MIVHSWEWIEYEGLPGDPPHVGMYWPKEYTPENSPCPSGPHFYDPRHACFRCFVCEEPLGIGEVCECGVRYGYILENGKLRRKYEANDEAE